MLGRVTDGPDLDFRTAGRDADDDLEVGGEKVFMFLVDALDETAYHHLGRIEVGDDAVPQGADGLDARIDTFVHQLGLLAEGDAFAGIIVDRHDARLVQGDHIVLEDDGIGGTEVDGEFLV